MEWERAENGMWFAQGLFQNVRSFLSIYFVRGMWSLTVFDGNRKKAFEKKRREADFAEADKSLGEGDVGFEFKIDLNAA